jgi:DNA-binding transcriptional ArsR family regulator
MPSSNSIASLAAAMGDPARINMVMALRHDGVLSATELSRVANVAPSTASEHLARLMATGLVTQQKAGRRRLYTLADTDVCHLVDGLAALAGKRQAPPEGRSALPRAVLHSRLCLDHLGGRLGCLVTNALFDRGFLRHGRTGPEITGDGAAWLAGLGIDERARGDSLRCPLRLCHDWSEDAYHLGGGVAGALLTAFRQRDWLRVRRGEIAVILTPTGVTALGRELGLDLRQVQSPLP